MLWCSGRPVAEHEADQLAATVDGRRQLFFLQWDQPEEEDHDAWYLARVSSATPRRPIIRPGWCLLEFDTDFEVRCAFDLRAYAAQGRLRWAERLQQDGEEQVKAEDQGDNEPGGGGGVVVRDRWVGCMRCYACTRPNRHRGRCRINPHLQRTGSSDPPALSSSSSSSSSPPSPELQCIAAEAPAVQQCSKHPWCMRIDRHRGICKIRRPPSVFSRKRHSDSQFSHKRQLESTAPPPPAPPPPRFRTSSLSGGRSGSRDNGAEIDAEHERALALASTSPGVELESVRWIQCEAPSCGQWMQLPHWIASDRQLPDHFFCWMNTWNEDGKHCAAAKPAQAAAAEPERCPLQRPTILTVDAGPAGVAWGEASAVAVICVACVD
jgi:hypothetical protein